MTSLRKQFAGKTLLVLAFALVVSCESNGGGAGAPVVPEGFDVSLLEVLACPENLSTLRLATGAELETLRSEVAQGTVRLRDGQPAPADFDGLLIREDDRVAYTIKAGVADMIPDHGLALDPTVGPADPVRLRR